MKKSLWSYIIRNTRRKIISDGWNFNIQCPYCNELINITSDSDGFLSHTADKSNTNSMSAVAVNREVSVFGDCPYCGSNVDIIIDHEKRLITIHKG